MNDRDYCYPPDFTVLRNKLDIRDTPTLHPPGAPVSL